MNKIILASQSPRRKELLMQVNVNFITRSFNVEEVFDEMLPLSEQIMQVALSKAKPFAEINYNDFVIGADTIVVIDNKKIGKPADKNEAREILELLSNRTHQVYTGVAICYQGKETLFYQMTEVSFYPLTREEIDNYLETNEWKDKAGAYAIQGVATKFVENINGDYNNVIGLPVAKLLRIIDKLKNT